MQDNLGDFVTIVGDDGFNTLQTSIIITQGIVKGHSYGFRYRCKNANGWSAYSDVTFINAAIVPGIPQAPSLISASSTSITLKLYPP